MCLFYDQNQEFFGGNRKSGQRETGKKSLMFCLKQGLFISRSHDHKGPLEFVS